MPEPASYRTLEIVRQWLAESSAIETTGVNLRDFSNDIADVDKPAVYVVAAGQDGTELLRESSGGVREDLPVLIAGWCKASDIDEDSEPVDPDVTLTRERLIQTIRARLAFEGVAPEAGGLSGTENDSLHARLRHDRATYGSGCEGFQETGPTIRDEGEAPPWGYCILRFVARLHYDEGAF